MRPELCFINGTVVDMLTTRIVAVAVPKESGQTPTLYEGQDPGLRSFGQLALTVL